MTIEEFVTAAQEAVDRNIGLTLVSATGRQPLPGYRGELLCVNALGEHLYRYTPAQCKRMLRAVRDNP